MSTKIHHGYRFRTSNGDPVNLFTLAAALRGSIRPVMLDSYRSRLAKLLAELHDGTSTLESSSVPLLTAERHMLDAAREIRATGRRNAALDFSCQVSLLPDSERCDTVYLLVFCEQNIEGPLLSIEGIDEYAYWNSTDRPDHVDDAEWDERRSTWDRVLGNDAPVTRGVAWELDDLTNCVMFDDVEAILAAVPSIEARARSLAVLEAVRAIVPDPDDPTHVLVRRITDAQRAAIADTERIAAIASTLAPLTHADVMGARVP